MISEKESGFNRRAETTLIKQAQAGSQESLNLLLLRHERLAHWIVRRQLSRCSQRGYVNWERMKRLSRK